MSIQRELERKPLRGVQNVETAQCRCPSEALIEGVAMHGRFARCGALAPEMKEYGKRLERFGAFDPVVLGDARSPSA